jgi:hypothetical protein
MSIVGLGSWISDPSFAARDKEGLSLPKDVYQKLADRAIKDIQESLHDLIDNRRLQGEQKRYTIRKARCAAFMLAIYAQLGDSTDERARATLRDAALKLAMTIEDGNYNEAKKKADTLENLPANPKAKLKPIPGRYIGIQEIMHQFRPSSQKGLDIESKLLKLSLASSKNKNEVPASALNEDLSLMAYQIAAVAGLTNVYKTK